MTRILITGAAGMLGQDVCEAFGTRHDVTAVDLPELDLTDDAAVQDFVHGFDVVVNCAAWTAVDAAETAEAKAFAVNATAAGNLARACARSDAWLLHISTDYVFRGNADAPWPEDAPIAPRSAYGRTKAAGEWAVRAELPARHWILRTAWLYGQHGPNFPRTMLRLEKEKPEVSVVIDEQGQPTWSRDLAGRIATIVERSLGGAEGPAVPAGTYHATSSGATTWFELAREVFRLTGADPARVTPTTAAAYARPAPRPSYSVLSHDGWARAGLPPMRPWDEALAEAYAEGVFA